MAQWIWRILLPPFSTSLCLRILSETSLFCFYPRIPRGRFCQLPFSIQLFMWTLVHDLCGSLCSWLWFLALSFLAGLRLHWQNLDCQCHIRLWTQPLCMVFPSEEGFPAHCLSELFDLTCCDPAKISLDKTCEAHDNRKGYLLDLLYI